MYVCMNVQKTVGKYKADRQYFCRKVLKIAEISYHNIGLLKNRQYLPVYLSGYDLLKLVILTCGPG
jgi:hypothetical protein